MMEMGEVENCSDNKVEACVSEQGTQMEKCEGFQSFNSDEHIDNQHLLNVCSGPFPTLWQALPINFQHSLYSEELVELSSFYR